MLQAFSTLTLNLTRLILPGMLGQRMDPNQASTRTSHRTTHPSSGNTAIATQFVVKKEEDDDDDDDGTYKPRPRLQEGSFYMRTLADLMSRL